MKRIIFSLAIALGLSATTFAQEQAPVSFVYGVYQDCLYYVEENAENRNRELLTCVNEELEYNEYSTFSSLKAIQEYIKDYNPEEENQA